MTVALVRNGIVENIIMAEEGYTPPEGFTVVSIEDAAELPRLTVEAPVDPREAIEAEYQAAISTGHCVMPEGFCLAMGDADRANWSQLLVLLREAEGLGAVDGSSLVDFLDITGTARQATLTRFRQIIVGLGQAYQTAFFTRSSALTALQG